MSTIRNDAPMGLKEFTTRVQVAGWSQAVRELQPHVASSQNYTAERKRFLPTLSASELLAELDRISTPAEDVG